MDVYVNMWNYNMLDTKWRGQFSNDHWYNEYTNINYYNYDSKKWLFSWNIDFIYTQMRTTFYTILNLQQILYIIYYLESEQMIRQWIFYGAV